MFANFQQFPNLVATVSTKTDGPMGLSYQVQGNETVKNRREKFLKKFGIDIKQLVTANLAHGNNIVIVNVRDAGTVIPGSDGLVTTDKNLFLSITVADCLPIFYFDPVQEVLALAHAGWRGILKEIPIKVVNVMREKFNSNPSDIVVAIGPNICVEHYEVKSDVASQFAKYGDEVFLRRSNMQFLDLAKVVKLQLLSSGIREEHIEISRDCNFELKDTYYSYRRDKPEKLETMIAVFGLRGK